MNELPQPTYQLSAPAAGWWKAPSSLGTDPVFLRVPETCRAAAIGVYISSIGWCLNHNAQNGWIPAAAVVGGQVVAALRQDLEAAAAGLVKAGVWCEVELEGLPGYVVAGAAKAVAERYARQESARQAGITSREVSAARAPSPSKYPPKKTAPDPNKWVDWSKETGEL